MLWGCFAVSESAALKKVNEIMKEGNYLQILQKNLKSSAEDLLLGAVGCSNRTMMNTTHGRSGKGMDQSGYN